MALLRKYRFGFLLLLILLLVITSSRVLFPAWPYELTGEENSAAQLRGLLQWSTNLARPLPRTADEGPIAYTELSPFGINTFLEQEVELEKRARSLQLISEAGFHWIRQEFPWEDIEIHGKGDFEDRRHVPHRSAWEKYDQLVASAEQYQLGIIVRLSNPPTWSRAAGDELGTYAPPDDFADYGDFVAAVVSRYRGRIRFYQVWNEPNIYPEWGKRPVDPEAYTELLCLAYKRIKAADPQAVVISGALAPTVALGTSRPDGGNALMDTVFLQRMYQAGAGACFDIMAVNDYMLWSGPTDRRMRPNLTNFSRPLWIRDLMVAHGDAGKPIWLTEMNSNAAPAGLPAIYGRVTEEQQARYAIQALERVQQEWPWVGHVAIWFFKRPSEQERGEPWYYFRLMEPDFTPLPIYAEIKEYLNTLAPTLYQGQHSAESWQLNYQGAWITSPEGTKSTVTAGASLTLNWQGRALELLPGNSNALIRVMAEGQSVREIMVESQPVLLDRDLLKRQHALQLVVLEGGLTIKGFQVE
ncbi:MAG TPA: hypothetical protein G4N98_00270 [Thermoflexia bacterium]|nr:hypothetical protein [Thermoflexia bacterium]